MADHFYFRVRSIHNHKWPEVTLNDPKGPNLTKNDPIIILKYIPLTKFSSPSSLISLNLGWLKSTRDNKKTKNLCWGENVKSINRSKRMFNLRVYVSRLEVSAKVRLKGMNKTRSWHWANFGPPRARTFLQNVSEHGERTNEMTLDECQIKWAGQKFRRRFGLQPGCFLELWTITIFFSKAYRLKLYLDAIKDSKKLRFCNLKHLTIKFHSYGSYKLDLQRPAWNFYSLLMTSKSDGLKDRPLSLNLSLKSDRFVALKLSRSLAFLWILKKRSFGIKEDGPKFPRFE